MRRGDFEAAWRVTDAGEAERRRGQLAPNWRPEPNQLLWDGTPFTGRSVLVRCLHGLGDTLQFIRFIPPLQALARHVAVLAQPPLVELLRLQPVLGEVRNGWTDFENRHGAVEIEVMELAYALRAQPSTVGCAGAYLRAPATATPRVSRGASPLQVGLLWAASDWDTSRSVPVSALAPLAAIEGVDWHCLQQGPASDAWAALPLPAQPLHQHTREITAAAAAMSQMDLIIAVDGMPAHLAGALGRPVWVMLPHRADWRWMDTGTTSPWYPTMRLFRQPAPGAWAPVVQQVAAALRQLTSSRSHSGAAPSPNPLPAAAC